MDPLALIGAMATGLIGKYMWDVPQVTRRHDHRVRQCDEDLCLWIEGEEASLHRKFSAWDIQNVGSTYRLARRKDREKRRLHEQLTAKWRQVSRLRDEVQLEEQLPHRIYRLIRRRPLTDLSGERVMNAWWSLAEPEEPTEPDAKLLAEMTRLGLVEIAEEA